MVEPWRVAQLAVDRGPGHDGSRGSGYLIAPGRVLTAAHVVAGASVVRVRLDVGQDTEVEVQADTWWADPRGHNGTDLAVVTIPEDAVAEWECEPARFGRISDGAAVLMVQAFGFPRFKLRDNSGDVGQPGVVRDFEQAGGHAPVAANRRQGTLAVYLDDPPPSQPTAGDPSPWEGMSGGSVWAAGRIVAVVAEHHPSEGTGRLTVRRIDRAYGQLPASDLGVLVELLGLAPVESGLPDAVPAERGQLVRSAYLAQVRDIAPDLLIGREGELADWAEFCAGTDPYAWWQAGPWGGKTALAAWFVTHPPAGVDVVSFFITSRLPGQADSDAFLEAMTEQLNALRPADGVSPAIAGARAGAWLNLLESAAAQAGERARRLAVVVDGLDEDDAGATPSRGRPSIVSLLPRRPPPGVRFIATSRPDPGLPDDLPVDHPLRICTPHLLPVSQAAKGIELHAKQELGDLLSGDQVAVDVVGYIAGSGGGLTRGDLSVLTGAPPRKLDPILRSVFGRSLETRTSTDPRNSQANPASRVYLFAHDTLRVKAEEQLGGELARYREKVHEWIGSYANADWPEATPGYAISGYVSLLAATGDVTRLSAIARNPRRHAFLLEATGSDYATLGEIETVQNVLVDQGVPDLKALAALAAYRHAISIRNQSIPPDLPIAWARLARFDHAGALARAITDDSARGEALAGVTSAIAQSGDLDRAEAFARTISEAYIRTWALTGLATVIAQSGDLDRAEALVRTLPDPGAQAEALTSLATAAGQAGDTDRAYLLAAAAETLARTITDPRFQGSALAHLAIAIAQIGDLDHAEAVGCTITDPLTKRQAWALPRLAAVIAQAGDLDRAEALARTFTDPRDLAEALAVVAAAIAQAGDLDRAEALARTITDPDAQAKALISVAAAIAQAGDLDRAEALARAITDPDAQAKALISVATTIAQAGDLERAYRSVGDIEALARDIGDPSAQAKALAGLAAAIAQAGDLDRAGQLAAAAQAVRPMPVGANAFSDLAIAIAQAGDLDRAEAFARTITDPDAELWALAGVAAAIAHAGDLDRAYRLASTAEALARARPSPYAHAEALSDLAIGIAQAGDLDRAEALARTISDPTAHARTMIGLVAAITQAGDLDRAGALARTITDPFFQAEAIPSLAAAIAQAGDLDRAEALARTITSPKAQAGALAGLVAPIAQAGELDRAEALARTITSSHAHADALAGLATAIAQAGDLDRAEALARTITDRTGLGIVGPVIAIAQAGDADRAEALARSLTSSALQSWVLADLVVAIAQAGDADRAEILARTITDESLWALPRLAIVIAQAGNLDRAEAVARTLTDPFDQALTLANLAKAAAHDGDLGRAYQLAAAAEALARTITNHYHQGRTLIHLAAAIAQAGDLDRAGRILAAVLVMDLPENWWAKAVSQFFPAVIEAAWDVLAGTYTTQFDAQLLGALPTFQRSGPGRARF